MNSDLVRTQYIDFILTFYDGVMGPTAGGCKVTLIYPALGVDICRGGVVIGGAVLPLARELRSSISTTGTAGGTEVAFFD